MDITYIVHAKGYSQNLETSDIEVMHVTSVGYSTSAY